jgi:hypothetical protein
MDYNHLTPFYDKYVIPLDSDFERGSHPQPIFQPLPGDSSTLSEYIHLDDIKVPLPHPPSGEESHLLN